MDRIDMKAVSRVVLASCTLMSCGRFMRDYELDDRSFTSQDLKMVEEKIGLTFPAGTRGLKMYHAQGGFDPWFMARIEVPSPSFANVAEQVEHLPKENESTAPFPDRLSKTVSWWHPPAGALERRFNRRGDFVNVWLVDEGRHAILWVIWAPVG